MSQTDLARKIWAIFSEPLPPQRKEYLNQIQKPGKITDPIHHFTPFREAHAIKAKQIADEFEKISKTGTNEEKGIEKVLELFLSLKGSENPDLLYYALKTFLINYEGELNFLIPSLLVREPELVIPGKEGITEEREIAVGSVNETRMDWFREDPSLNEHHGHWHIVYSNQRFKNRQGEMFYYMHQQMIARYDADRICSGVPRVKAFDNMRDRAIEVGYAAGEDARLSEFILGQRNPGVKVDAEAGKEQVRNLELIRNDIHSTRFDPQDPFRPEMETKAMNLLGSTLESNPQAVNRPYVNYHGNGHVAIGELNQGVMFLTEAAIRDVVFWEWHKGVDDLFYLWQEKLSPNNFSADAPKIKFRKSIDHSGRAYSADLILCRKKDINATEISAERGQQLADLIFKGSGWDKDFAKGSFQYNDGANGLKTIRTTDTLQTKMKEGVIRYQSPNGERRYNYPYLTHDEFCYFIRIENTSLQQQLITVRIFMVPEEFSEDRRSWIEMDKFLYTLPPNAKSVIYRSDSESSVIRKPAVKNPANYNTAFDPLQIPFDDRQCGCGWPYHMLLPRGTDDQTGKPFKLMVMITDGRIDLVAKEPDCGSLSFCGARSNDYPDKRPLGYPFNRKFSGNGTAIQNAINTNPNMMCRTIFIKHLGS